MFWDFYGTTIDIKNEYFYFYPQDENTNENLNILKNLSLNENNNNKFYNFKCKPFVIIKL